MTCVHSIYMQVYMKPMCVLALFHVCTSALHTVPYVDVELCRYNDHTYMYSTISAVQIWIGCTYRLTAISNSALTCLNTIHIDNQTEAVVFTGWPLYPVPYAKPDGTTAIEAIVVADLAEINAVKTKTVVKYSPTFQILIQSRISTVRLQWSEAEMCLNKRVPVLQYTSSR